VFAVNDIDVEDINKLEHLSAVAHPLVLAPSASKSTSSWCCEPSLDSMMSTVSPSVTVIVGPGLEPFQ